MEMKEVIPSCWVKNGDVLWPTQGAARALKACKEPEESWTKFPLIKIKIQSDEQTINEDSQKESAPGLMIKSTEFQKRVLQLLLEIKDTIHVATSSAGTSYEVKPANTEEELEALENRLEDKNEGAELSKYLKRLGGVDAADLVKKSMAATMTNKMMAKMSLRGRSGKVAFMKTHLYKTICDAVFSSFNTTTTKV
ncbi:hypothetical protein ABVT39_005260 [Epinephelus coioides]